MQITLNGTFELICNSPLLNQRLGFCSQPLHGINSPHGFGKKTRRVTGPAENKAGKIIAFHCRDENDCFEGGARALGALPAEVCLPYV